MWINEIINVVVENKNIKQFYEKSLWTHDGMNIIIQFVERCAWGAVELTSEQYELIEETSSENNTYDTQYNTSSRFDIKVFEEMLFTIDRKFSGTEFCKIRRLSGKVTMPDDDTLEAMSNLSWFEVNYGTGKGSNSALYETLSENGWIFLGHSYSIDGDIKVMKKSDYDYLWINDDISDKTGTAVEKGRYGLRIGFLTAQEKS